jgi:putative spermidine/putrescine transport system permease protein
MIRNCMAALDGLDPALEEAARTLGASPLRAFFGIVLPLMRSGILSGFLLVFILSLNEFTLAYFLFTIDSFPLSMWLFQASSSNLNPSVFAVSTLVIIINVALILAVDRVRGAKGVAL